MKQFRPDKGLGVVCRFKTAGRLTNSRACSSRRRSQRLAKTHCRINDESYLSIGGGDRIKLPKRRRGIHPNVDLTRDEAILVQLKGLQDNNYPYIDHGVEVMYRFSNFDPFKRSSYFGRLQDLGQFERFRRMMHSKDYFILLGHTEHKFLSCLQVAGNSWKQRVWVKHKYRMNEEAIFEFTMVQRLGGRYDSYFFTESLKRDLHLTLDPRTT